VADSTQPPSRSTATTTSRSRPATRSESARSPTIRIAGIRTARRSFACFAVATGMDLSARRYCAALRDSEISLPALDRRGPLAVAERAVAVLADVGDALVPARELPPHHGHLQPVEHVVVAVQAAEVGDAPQRVVLVLEN